MPIAFRAPAISALLNETFVYKKIDDDKRGRLGLFKADINEADAVNDVQAYLNEVAQNIGQDGENDGNANNYSSNFYISNGENRKEAIESLDVALDNQNTTILNISALIADGAIKLKGYISDSAYESDNGAPGGGELYYNTTTGAVRYYDGIEAAWKPIGESVLGIQEQVGVGDGVTTAFTISNAPLNDEALNVYVNGVLVNKAEYSISLPTLTFNDAPAAGSEIYLSYLSNGSPASPVISAGTNNVIYHVITAAQESAKEFTLPTTPSEPTRALVDIIGGSSVRFGTDFNISGNIFEWDGLSLDGLLEENDILRIQYFN